MNTPHDDTIKIVRECAEMYGTNVNEVLGRSRIQRVIDARWLAVKRIREEKRLSLTQIGTVFGRDHSTISHILKQTRAGLRPWEGKRVD